MIGTGIHRLPEEVLRYIFEHVVLLYKEDKARLRDELRMRVYHPRQEGLGSPAFDGQSHALSRLQRVCKRWMPPAREVLYGGTIFLQLSSESVTFLALSILTIPQLGTMLRSLDVGLARFDQALDGRLESRSLLLLDIIKRTPNIKEIRLRAFPRSIQGTLTAAIRQLAGLKTLAFDFLVGSLRHRKLASFSLAQYLEIAQSYPFLKTLQLSNAYRTSMPVQAGLWQSQASLTSLTLQYIMCCDNELIAMATELRSTLRNFRFFSRDSRKEVGWPSHAAITEALSQLHTIEELEVIEEISNMRPCRDVRMESLPPSWSRLRKLITSDRLLSFDALIHIGSPYLHTIDYAISGRYDNSPLEEFERVACLCDAEPEVVIIRDVLASAPPWNSDSESDTDAPCPTLRKPGWSRRDIWEAQETCRRFGIQLEVYKVR